MSLRAVLLAALYLLAPPARAELPQAPLDEVALAPPAGAVMPLDVILHEGGAQTTLTRVLARRPASLLVFADYTCTGVCGTALAIAASSLASPDMAGIDAGLLVIGLDPKDGPREARRVENETVGAGSQLAGRAAFLTADAATVERLTQAAGYRYRYDPATDQFAHPAAGLVVSRDGAVGRPLASLSLMPETLRRALVEAGNGEVGGVLERIALRCYSFDPLTGFYTADVKQILRLAGLATVGGLVLLVVALARRSASAKGGA